MQVRRTDTRRAKARAQSARRRGPSMDDPFYAARHLSVPVWVFDIDLGRVIFANAKACVMWQADTEKELCARDMGAEMTITVARRLRQYQADFERAEATFHELWTFYPHGQPLSANIALRGFRLPDGRMAMQCEVLERADDMPENLRSAEALLHTDVMIALFELRGVGLYLNPAARNAFGAAARNLSALFAKTTDYHVMMFDLDGKGEHRMVAKAATEQGMRWLDISAKLCRDAATGCPAVLLTAIDVTELKTARDKARYLADRDQLTGCYNRSFLQRYLERPETTQAGPHVLLYFDVDKFKQVNDIHGHEAGDDVLKELAWSAQKSAGEDGIVVRLGGDEFAILLKQTDATVSATDMVQRSFWQLSASVVRGATSIVTSVSVGATVFDPALTAFETALQQADIALYQSKRAGRDCYTLYTAEMGHAAEVQSNWEMEIRNAVRGREFMLHYQPRQDLRSGKTVSMEGLVRWDHPVRGVVPPSEFIPICEETGMIEALGQQVLDMGFDQALKWADAGIDIQLSLNISPRQFADNRLMQFLEDFAKISDFPAEKIELEITENVLIGDLDAIAAKLHKISAWGYRIAVDDFGTGYSNLSYISRFPLSCLKIDTSFIQQLPNSGPIVGLIIALAKQIGATIVAEGVETQDQYDWLKDSGCDQVQGFLISKPARVEALDGFLPRLRKAK